MSSSYNETIQLAHAKLTTRLRVIGVRADGYHLLDAEMVSLDLADVLRFSPGNGLAVTGATAERVPITDDNLVNRAMRLVDRTAYVHLEKVIPAGGGLGGGSSDAASVLRWAGVIDEKRAVDLGADVPFCLRGGRARVTGVGEIVQPLPFEERTYTLLLPPFGVSTSDVFAAFDDLARTGAGAATGSSDNTNDLEVAAITVEAGLAEWRDKLARLTGRTPSLAGSGSTWFVEGAFPAPSEVDLEGGRWVVARTTPAIALG